MELIHWIAWAFAVVLGGLAVSGLRDHWRGEHPLFDSEPPSWWLWGRQLWEGWSRSAPAMAFGFMVTVITLPVAFALSTDTLAFKIIGGACVGGIVLAVTSFLTITLFNWPSVAVPPHLRQQRGVIRRSRASRQR